MTADEIYAAFGLTAAEVESILGPAYLEAVRDARATEKAFRDRIIETFDRPMSFADVIRHPDAPA